MRRKPPLGEKINARSTNTHSCTRNRLEQMERSHVLHRYYEILVNSHVTALAKLNHQGAASNRSAAPLQASILALQTMSCIHFKPRSALIQRPFFKA